MLPKAIELSGMSLNVILAENVSFNKEGKPTTMREILSNPKNYEMELVKVLAFRRQISILYDPDDGSEVEVQVTTGYLSEEREKVPELVRGAIRKGGDLIRDPSRSLVKDILRTERSRLPFFDFEHDYWMDSQAETNGIVLVPDAPILDLLRRVVPIIGELIGLEELPVLYDVETSLVYEEVSSVEEVNRNPEEYIGKVIGLSAYGLGGGISIQESIKAATGEEIEADVRLEGLEAWSTLSVPLRKEELLTVVGASNTHQDEAFSRIDGEFQYIGRVISAKQIDESLPAEMPALAVYQRQKIGEIDYERLQPVEEEIEDKLEELYFVIEEQPPTPTPTPTPTPAPTPTPTPTPTITPTPTPTPAPPPPIPIGYIAVAAIALVVLAVAILLKKRKMHE